MANLEDIDGRETGGSFFYLLRVMGELGGKLMVEKQGVPFSYLLRVME